MKLYKNFHHNISGLVFRLKIMIKRKLLSKIFAMSKIVVKNYYKFCRIINFETIFLINMRREFSYQMIFFL